MIMRDNKPRKAFILERGAIRCARRGGSTGLDVGLSPVPDNMPMNRLALARWLTDGQHPLTARVLVNRLWEQLFGVGIVKSSENLGVQTDWPSHPQLLDWLAVDFVEHGWNIKRMLRQMLMSAAYRQDAATNSERLRLDPENRLRAEAHARDSRPRWCEIGAVPFRLDGRETRWAEHVGLSAMACGARSRSGSSRIATEIVPAQPLLAHPSYRRASQHAVVRRAEPRGVHRETLPYQHAAAGTRADERGDLRGGVEKVCGADYCERCNAGRTHHWAFRAATARQPEPTELALLTAGYERRLARFRAQPKTAEQLLGQGESPSMVRLTKRSWLRWPPWPPSFGI